jgi:ferrous iron transport protein B
MIDAAPTSAAPTTGTPEASSQRMLHVALVGNPNVGKTTLFNRLTGARQRVGNYPGVTVERKAGRALLGDVEATFIDLPGTYSLAAASADERVVIDALLGRLERETPPDVIVCVVDASNLMRNLFLASQVADMGVPSVVALNMCDVAESQGVAVEAAVLSQRLGVPVVPICALKGEGIDALKRAVREAAGSPRAVAPMPWPACVEEGLAVLGDALAHRAVKTASKDRPATRVELLRLLFDIDSAIPDRLHWPRAEREPIIAVARQRLHAAGLNPVSAEAMLRYARLGEILDGVLVHRPAGAARGMTRGESIDRLLTHRVWGLIIFVGLMTLVFQSIYTLAGPLMDGVDSLTSFAASVAAVPLESTPMLQSLVVDGVIGGVGSVIIFLPQILILFFFIALLEDTGYMARAAFLMDKLFSWCGLNGRSFVPMLSSYACAIPGVMATRTIDDPKARLVTILIAPLMSCSARLPVYVLMIGAFIEPSVGPWWAGASLVGMHFVGLLVALPVALVLNRFVVRGRRVPFVMEMPPYRTPLVSSVLWRMWQAGMKFLRRAGTVIFAMTVVIWALTYFPRPDSVAFDATQRFVERESRRTGASTAALEAMLDESTASFDTEAAARLENEVAGAYVEQSYLGRLGRAAQPVFAPAGFDWKITVGVLASFPAREVIVATLGILYNLGGEVDEESADLLDTMKAARWDEGPRAGELVFTAPVAWAIMVFFALCLQCGSTVAVIARESSWKWAIFAFTYMTVLAWVAAVAVYQLGSRF